MLPCVCVVCVVWCVCVCVRVWCACVRVFSFTTSLPRPLFASVFPMVQFFTRNYKLGPKRAKQVKQLLEQRQVNLCGSNCKSASVKLQHMSVPSSSCAHHCVHVFLCDSVCISLPSLPASLLCVCVCVCVCRRLLRLQETEETVPLQTGTDTPKSNGSSAL